MSRQETFELLDAALQLVEEAKVADRQRTEVLETTAAYVRDWWQQPRR
jgi:DNA-binding ferritin-like protein (Dps family)